MEEFRIKPGHWIAGGLGLVLLILLVSYNGIVDKDEAVGASWSEVSNQAKRRADLIPQLVKVVKGYAEHERGVFDEVTAARAKATSITIDAGKLAANPELQKQFVETQQALSASLGRLLAVAENYPNLKANENFKGLQDEISGSENRIAVARRRAIVASQDYNRAIRQVPGVLIARFGGFEPKVYYEAPAKDLEVPDFDFGKKN